MAWILVSQVPTSMCSSLCFFLSLSVSLFSDFVSWLVLLLNVESHKISYINYKLDSMSTFDKKPISCSYGFFPAAIFAIVFHCLFGIDEIAYAQNESDNKTERESALYTVYGSQCTHVVSQTQSKNESIEHTHGCAQVDVNAHLYCTKIRWNELLMKLKYEPVKSCVLERSTAFLWNLMHKVPVHQVNGKSGRRDINNNMNATENRQKLRNWQKIARTFARQ